MTLEMNGKNIFRERKKSKFDQSMVQTKVKTILTFDGRAVGELLGLMEGARVG